jgi:hypothetical protein
VKQCLLPLAAIGLGENTGQGSCGQGLPGIQGVDQRGLSCLPSSQQEHALLGRAQERSKAPRNHAVILRRNLTTHRLHAIRCP